MWCNQTHLSSSPTETPVRSPFATAIASSHVRCRNAGLDVRALPQSGSVPAIYPQRALMGNGIIKDILGDFHSYIYNLGGTTLYAYDDMRVLDPWDDMNALPGCLTGIFPGVDLREESAGTNAASLISPKLSEAWVVGEEHYLSVLHPFATYCSYSRDADGGLYTLVILPKEKLDGRMLSYTRLLQRTKREAILRFRIQTERTALEELTHEKAGLATAANLFVDRFGNMLWGNDLFLRAFGVSVAEIRGQRIESLFPELRDFRMLLGAGKGQDTASIAFARTTKLGFAVFSGITPIGEEEEPLGFSLRFKISRASKAHAAAHNGARYTFGDIIGESPAMRTALSDATDAALSESAVLLLGESGTGKELFAQSIHNASSRRSGPFVPVNCANLQHDLIESELFGYAGGSFTGANRQGSMGKIEYADGGTLFLDEIGELPLSVQAMLLRTLEERSISRIGSNRLVPVDFRLICATNRDILQMVRDGSFRADLYYRINVLCLTLPPLRARAGDVALLARYFVHLFNDALGTDVSGVSPEACRCLERYSWPGNLREMRNVMERAIQHAKGTIQIDDLPPSLLGAIDGAPRHTPERQFTFVAEPAGTASRVQPIRGAGDFADAERGMLISLYLETGGNKSLMAQKLGISRTTLYKKIKRYGLQ